MPVVSYRDGTTGYLTADLGFGESSEKHMLAFESRRDAEAVQLLFQANMDEHVTRVHVIPMNPEQLSGSASEHELAVAVYSPGQLQLKPGMTTDQIGEAAAACR